MSDSGRVQIPYGTHSTSNKTKNLPKKTIRICVRLPPSTEDTCPEYNFKDELDAAKKRGSSKNVENGDLLDMFADDDGDVRRIAKEMEEKYGKGVAVSKKKRRGRKDDYADIGMGYDESDSFIDNTDGYDEIIPQNVTTLYGGFYINCGALEFKTDDENSDDSSSSSSKSRSSSPRNGKRALESDDSDTEIDKDRQIKKSKSESFANGMQKAIKKKLFSPNKILKKKRSSGVFKKTVKDLLKEKRRDLNLTVIDSPSKELNNSVLTEGKNTLENGKTSSNISDVIESVVKASDEPIFGGDRLSSQGTDEVKPAQLPENLPNNIAEVIAKLKQTANNSGNKFTDEINSLLLSLERKCKCLGKPSKTKVYEHLSHFIKIDKHVLIKHCHQLMLKEEEKKIKSLLHKLKLEIDKLMPGIILNYDKECELVLEKRSLLQQQNQEGGDEKRKQIGRPRRKFQWNDQTKKYLKDTATLKKRSYLQQGNSKESWEEELSSFLKNNVLHLWPEGWMTMTTLTKMCNKLFNDPKTANQTSSNAKKENKNTAPNTSNIAYPNISITPLKANAEKCANKEQKVEIVDVDAVNSNGNTFYKVEYEKPVNVENKDVKQANIVIDLDSPSDFSNLLPKTKSFDEKPVEIEKITLNDENHRNPNDDIQKVMERLKNLQKMSSPVKTFEGSSSSNAGFSQKTSSVLKNNIDLVTSSFQDEFQKQLYSALGNLTQTSSKSNYKCS